MSVPATAFWGDTVLDEAVRSVGTLATQGFTGNNWARGGINTGGGASATNTWSPINKGTNIALSNGDLTATQTVTSYRSGRATTSKTSGKQYFECTADSFNSAVDFSVGLADAIADLETYLGPNTHSVGYYADGSVYNDSLIGTLGAYAEASVVRCAVDFDAGKAWFGNAAGWNGGDPAAGTGAHFTFAPGAEFFPAFSLHNGTTPDAVTANFGGSAFAYAVPSGFTSWNDASDSNALRARFTADGTRRNWNQIIWAGRLTDSNATIKAAIAAMVGLLTHSRYIIVGAITNAEDADERPGDARFDEIAELNDDLRTLYGAHFYDAQEFLMFRGQAAGDTNSITHLGPSSADQDADGTLSASAYNALFADINRYSKSQGYLAKAALIDQVQKAGGRATSIPVPSITSSATGTVAEGAVYTITLTSNMSNPVWEIVGGDDQALFDFTEDSTYENVTLRMLGQDFEAPADLDDSNTYKVIIRASDAPGSAASRSATQEHVVTVTDVADETTPITETTAYTDRMQVAPLDQEMIFINTLTRRLKRDGVWAKLSGLWLPMTHSGFAGSLNVKGVTGPLVNNGALHVSFQGFLGDGVDDYVAGPTCATLDATLNKGNFGFGAYVITDAAQDDVLLGCSNSANIKLCPRNAAGNLTCNPLSSVEKTVAVESSYGMHGFQRTSSRTGFIWSNGEVVETSIGTASELPTGDLRLLADNSGNFDTRLLSIAFVMKDGNEEDWANLEAALTEYVDAVLAFIPEPQPAPRCAITFDGVNGGTEATDEAGGKTITFIGDAATNGNGEVVFDGSGNDAVSMADSDDWQLPIQWTLRIIGTPTNMTALNQALAAHHDTVGDQRSYQARYINTGRMQWFYSIDGVNSAPVIQSAPGVVVADHEQLFQWERDAFGVIRLFHADITAGDTHADMVASGTFAGDFFNSSAAFTLGNIANLANPAAFRMKSFDLRKNETLCGSDAGFDIVPQTPPETFKVYNTTRFPGAVDLANHNMRRRIIVYESSFWPTSVHEAPDLPYLRNTRIPALKSQFPGIDYLMFDIETWPIQAPSRPDYANSLQYHLDVLAEFHITHRLQVTGGAGTFVDGETVSDGTRSGVYKSRQSTSTNFGIISANTTQFSGTLTGATSGATRTITPPPVPLPAGTSATRLLFPQGTKFSYYGEVPIRSLNHLIGTPSEIASETTQWNSFNDSVRSVALASDWLNPSCYMIGVLSRNWATITPTVKASTITLMRQYIQAMVDQARRLDSTKEVWCILWNSYHSSGQTIANGWPANSGNPLTQLPREYMYEILKAVYDAGADAAAIWSSAGGSPAFDPNAGWMLGTDDFIEEYGVTL